ncbi:MAG: hypothetical protein AABX11_05775 [Nanoarchaeota archaeon]
MDQNAKLRMDVTLLENPPLNYSGVVNLQGLSLEYNVIVQHEIMPPSVRYQFRDSQQKVVGLSNDESQFLLNEVFRVAEYHHQNNPPSFILYPKGSTPQDFRPRPSNRQFVSLGSLGLDQMGNRRVVNVNGFENNPFEHLGLDCAEVITRTELIYEIPLCKPAESLLHRLSSFFGSGPVIDI